MTVWDDVVGQPAAVEVLAAAAAAGLVGHDGRALPGPGMTHAWLLTGPPGSGRSVAARAFAAALQCPSGGCGSCHACRTALAGSHADVTVVATQEVQLRVDAVKPLVELAQRRPSQGRWRVVVLEDADRLNDTTGNVLLKSVEEPPPRTVWLLCAPSAEDVIPTIRSRCRQVGLRIPPPDAVADLLVRRDGVDPALAAFAARAAQSHIGVARRLATDEDARIRRREVLQVPLRLRSLGDAVLEAGAVVDVAKEEAAAATAGRDAAERAELLRALGADGGGAVPPAVRSQVRQMEEDQKRRATRAQRDVLDRTLLDLLSLYRDVLVVQLGADVALVNGDMRADLQRLARASSPESTLRRMEAVVDARRRLSETTAAPLLAVEAMAVQLVAG